MLYSEVKQFFLQREPGDTSRNSSEKDAMDESLWKTRACVLFSPRCGLGENVQRDIKTWMQRELEDTMETI